MSEVPETARRIRFGPYEVDLAAGELRKNGRVVRLQEQPFQILAALLDRPGEVVTRDDLRERLWAGDTNVDFDQGLNTAINKLREALGDSAANPQFIETLPKRGYRFLFPLDEEHAPVSEAPKTAQELEPRLRLKLRYVAAAAVVVVAAAGFALVSLRRPVPDSPLPYAASRFGLRRRFPQRLCPVPTSRFRPTAGTSLLSPAKARTGFGSRISIGSNLDSSKAAKEPWDLSGRPGANSLGSP